MSEPIVLRWPLPAAPVDGAGRPVVCPVCGTGEGLVLGMDLDDHSDAPSAMACPSGHSWFEERFPRRYGALLLADVLDAEPGLLADLALMQRMHEAA
ncbi:hypothetical protein [Streptomyces sp. NPDC086182]|uniref:hypothetical protein n=1 Tax=Streptomyces sp. NPDC086182 TaxID=3155058 RepID=UPI0034421F4C